MGSVKTKLTDDARQDNLIIKRRVETTNSQQNKAAKKGANLKVPQPPSYVETIEEVKSYRDEQAKFDEILVAVSDYFDLFKNNTDRLEDLWMQLLEFLGLPNPNEHTVFRQTHYSTYIRIVIKNEEIKAIIDEATRWKDHKDFAPQLESHLNKIFEIQEGAKKLPENYQ